MLGAAVLAGVGVLLYVGPSGPGHPYWRFHRRGPAYYSRLGHACDAVLRDHPHFTKHAEGSGKLRQEMMLWMDDNNVAWEQTRLSATDASLPDVVRELHPDEILLSPNRVWLGFGLGRVAWSITWQRDDVHTNKWTLQSNGDGLVKIV